MTLPTIRCKEDLCEIIETYGFLPFFRNVIPGFSIAEACAPELWFSEGVDGPWEWKGPVIRETGCAYGKFFAGKAVYVSQKFFPDFANYRRDGYDYDARVDDGLARNRDARIMKVISENPSLLSRELKRASCPGDSAAKQFDANIVYLQMQTYITVVDFEYETDKHGKPYGWGIARYATPDIWYGESFRERVYAHEPEESLALLVDHLCTVLPGATESSVRRLLARRD